MNRYWVGGNGNWDASDTTHWSASSGGAGGASVPTVNDEVFIDTNSGNPSVSLQTNVSIVAFWLFFGSFSTNNFNMDMGEFTAGDFNNPANTPTLNLGSSTINTGDFQVTSNAINLNAGTSTINITATDYAEFTTVTTLTATFYNVTAVAGNTFRVSGPLTFNNLSFVPAGIVQNNRPIFYLYNNITVNGTLTVTGFDQQHPVRMQHIYSPIVTPIVLTAAAVSLTRVDFEDITAAGAAVPFTGTRLGDRKGNTNITFPASVNKYWVGDGGSWSDTAHWSNSSGGASGANLPLPQDDVFFDASSFSIAAQTITYDHSTMGRNVSFATVTNAPVFSVGYFTSFFRFDSYVYGNMTFGASMSLAGGSIWLKGRGNQTLTTNGLDITTGIIIGTVPAGKYTLQDNFLSTAPTNGVDSIKMTGGTFDANNKNITAKSFNARLGQTNAFIFNNISIIMGSGTWHFVGQAARFEIDTETNEPNAPLSATLSSGTSTLIIENNGASLSVNLYMYGNIINPNFNNVILRGNTLTNRHCNIAGNVAVTFNNLTIDQPPVECQLYIDYPVFPEDVHYTVNGTFTALGLPGKKITLTDDANYLGSVISGSVFDGGINYRAGDILNVDIMPALGENINTTNTAIFQVDSVDVDGAVTGASVLLDQYGNLEGGYYYFDGLHNMTNHFDYTGQVLALSLVSGGGGYNAGDQVSILANVDDNLTASGCLIEVLTVNGSGAVLTFQLITNGEDPPITGGTGYVTGLHDGEDFGGGSLSVNITEVRIDLGSGAVLDIDSHATQVFLGAAVANVAYVDVQNNHAEGAGILFDDRIGGINSGNNTNWLFGSAADLYLQTVYMVGADVDGDVQTINIGKSDNGTPINFELETQQLEFGNVNHLKQISDKIVVFADKAFDTVLQGKVDASDYKQLLYNLDRRVNILEDVELKGYQFTFKWLGETDTLSPIFEGLYIEKITDLGVTRG